MEGTATKENRLDEWALEVREEIEGLKRAVRAMEGHSQLHQEQTHLNQHRDMKASIELAYRHLEDARMRLGKLIQAMSKDGASKYDKQ